MGQADREADAEGSSAPQHEEEEFDLERLKQLAGFLLRAPKRRPRLAAFAFLLTLGLGVTIAAFWPRSYAADTRILAQHNFVLPALDNPNRQVPREADSPTKNAADTIQKRENIVGLVKQLDLIDRWDTTRQPILKLKDRIFVSLFGARSEEDRLLDLIGLVEKRLVVATDESSINISVEWPDREMSYEIVSLVLKNFLEARYDANVNVITEAIRILEERAKPQSDEVDAALEELSKREAELRGKAPVASAVSQAPGSPANAAPPSPVAVRSPAQPASASVDTGDTTQELEDVRRRIRELDEDHRRQLSQAQNQLADARTTLGPMHPTVLALTEKIQQLSNPPPELPALRAREHTLVAKVAAGALAASPSSSSPTPRGPSASASAASESRSAMRAATLEDMVRDDPAAALARSKLQAASSKYNELLSRIEAANIELDVTRASFKYQYTVVRPPELARKPSKPNVPLVLILSVIMACIMTIFIPGGLDLLRGRFVEAWQVERELGLPLLGELTPPR
jgi:uncharacterized protein involved in exopolysaccharide biosynthesis